MTTPSDTGSGGTAVNGRGFNGNDYRKRVLAAIDARGGAQTSDPFEWYDVPIEDAGKLPDEAVAEQVAAVWAFWQKQRDHPKYRGLVTALLAAHREASAELLDRDSRGRLADQARALRAERDHARFTELDAAIQRLVERFGGIPRSKLEGLRAFGRQSGADLRSVDARLARHRTVDDQPAPPRASATTISPAVYRQVRADLDELGRILGIAPPVSLYDLLGLDASASREQLSHERELAAARNRELRPDRRRALVDDLLAAVTTLLLENDPEAYLDALAEEVTERLRSRVAAAVLVEDELTADDYRHLLGEAQALGLDHERALRVLSALAKELDVAVPRTAPGQGGARASSPHRKSDPDLAAGRSGSARASHEALSEARAALRAGQVLEAQHLVAQARRLAGEMLPPIRAVSDEVDAVLVEAHQRWRAALQALAARRFTEAGLTLERLLRIAADLPGPGAQSAADVWAEACTGSQAAADALEAAQRLVGPARERALLDAVRSAPDHPGLLAALEATGVQPATGVRARVSGRFVVVSWVRSSSPGTIDYRVEHVDDAGGRQAIGTTQSTELEAALPPGANAQSTYAVLARRAGVSSVEALCAAPGRAPARSPGQVKAPAPGWDGARSPLQDVAPPAVGSLVLLPHGRRIRLVYPAPAVGRAEVRRLPDGASLPAPGALVADPAFYGEVVPAMGAGLAVDRRPSSPTAYVVLTIGTTVAVAGASTWYVALEPVTELDQRGGLLQWTWPAGCTEVVLSWRPDAPPEHANDPAAVSRKLTNTRYQIDGGVVLPTQRPLHVAVFTCTRMDGTLVTACEAPDGARFAQP